MKRTAIAVNFFSTTALLVAAPANAAPVDDFLNQMTADNIVSSGSSHDLVVAARETCDMLDIEDGGKVSQFVYEETGLDMNQSYVFVADAIRYFCPWEDRSGGQVWAATHPGGQALQ